MPRRSSLLLFIPFVLVACLQGQSNGQNGLKASEDEQVEIELLPEFSDWTGLIMGFSHCSTGMSPLFEEQAHLLRELAATARVKVLADDACMRALESLAHPGIELQAVESDSRNLKWIRDHSLVWARTEQGLVATELPHGRSSAGGIEQLVTSLDAAYANRTNAPYLIHGGNFQISSGNRCFAAYTAGYVSGFDDLIRPVLQEAGCQEIIRINLPSNLQTKHLDMVFHQLDRNTIALARYPGAPEDDALMQANKSAIEALGLRVLEIEHFSKQRSYVNVVVVGDKVFVPQYGAEQDDKALDAYRSIGFSPIGIPMEQHARTGGAIHCLTNYFMEP